MTGDIARAGGTGQATAHGIPDPADKNGGGRGGSEWSSASDGHGDPRRRSRSSAARPRVRG
ncbi:MAG: hypothetical protein IPH03_10020 [Tetrasphaera sp.]|nr:hypothetical protein [Tetrasphaera sp.]